MSTQVERRPFLIALAALSIGIACKWDLPVLLFLIPLLVLTRSTRGWSIVLGCLVLGYIVSPPRLPVLKLPQTESGPAKIVEEGYEAERFTAATADINGLRVSLTTPAGTHLHVGEVIPGPFKVKAV